MKMEIHFAESCILGLEKYFEIMLAILLILQVMRSLRSGLTGGIRPRLNG
jgi:hypothetical protein